jgi:hypothetical protein
MKRIRIMLVLGVTLLSGILAAETVSAHGGYYRGHRSHFGVFIGAPLLWSYPSPYYYYPPAYYPPVVAAPAEPPVYVERGDTSPARERAQDYWYYCPETQAYYPYVKQCARGWQRVAPQPQN